MVTNHIKRLENNEFTLDQALIPSKAFSQSRYLSTRQRDQIIELVEKLGKPEKGCLVQLPQKYKDIEKEIVGLVKKQEYTKSIKLAKSIENEEDGVKFQILGFLYKESNSFNEAGEYYKKAINKGETEALFPLAYIYHKQKRFNETENTISKPLKKEI